MKYQIGNLEKAEMKPEDVCYVYTDNKILIHFDSESKRLRLPTRTEIEIKNPQSSTIFKLESGWALEGETFEKQKLKGGFTFQSLRDVLGQLATPVAKEAAVGAQYVNWSSIHKFCGHCGEKLKLSTTEVAKTCSSCEKTFYPQLSPVVITLIRRGREVLLAKGQPPKKFFSCIAGFVEPGESLEECLRREVKEEVGLEVKNMKYFGSQPWPFPNNLMVGFTADWVAGEVQVDTNEITEARWFDRDQLPEELPPRSSISRQLIEAFRKG